MNKDIMFLLALELDNNTLLSICRSSKKMNEIICKNPNFWKMKIEKERPGLLEILGERNPNYKEIYEEITVNDYVCSINYSTNPLEIHSVIKGTLEEYFFYPLSDCLGAKVGDKVWGVVSSDEIIEPLFFYDKESAKQLVLREFEFIYDELALEGDIEEFEYYKNQLDENNYVKIDIFEFLIKEVKIL